jgi:hypothetical protein
MRDNDRKGANVIHVKVTVTQSGNDFNPVYEPPIIPVKHNNSVIRFRLDSATADEIIFDTVTVPDWAKDQLGTPEISQNGKQVDILDKNTVKETIHPDFTYKNKNAATQMLKVSDGICEVTGDFPQIENDPP